MNHSMTFASAVELAFEEATELAIEKAVGKPMHVQKQEFTLSL